MGIKTLELELTRLSELLKDEDHGTEEYNAIWCQLCKVADDIRDLRNAAYAEGMMKKVPSFKRFINDGFRRKAFKPQAYELLRSTFGHVAHTDIGGFYATMFGSDASCVRCLEYMLAYQPKGYMAEVETAIQEAIEESGCIAALETRIVEQKIAWEKAKLAELGLKYGWEDRTT